MSDFPFTEDDSDSAPKDTPRNSRMGQLPSWLSASEQGRWRDGDIELVVAYQSQVFENYMGTSFNRCAIVSFLWFLIRRGNLRLLNSYGIETQLPFLPDVEHNL